MSKKAWFYRQLLSYMPAFFIVVSFLFFVFFQLLGEQSRKEAVRANETFLLQAMRSVDSSLKTIDRMLLSELLHNPDLSAFFDHGEQDDVYLNMRVVKAMNQFMVSYPLVDSMYMVRARDEFVISNATSSKLPDYADYPFVKPYAEGEASGESWSAVRSFREFGFKDARSVVSLVRKTPFASGGFVVVNVPADSIYETIGTMYDPSVSFIRILDAEGANVLAGREPKDGRAATFSRYVSPYTGWTFESGLVNGKLAGIVGQLYNVWVAIGVLMMAAGVGWIVYVTRRSYRPIEQIVSRIQSFSHHKTSALLNPKRQDEFAFIESALDTLIEQSNRFQQQHREDMPLRKAYLFQQLVEGQYPARLAQWEAHRDAMQLPDLAKRQAAAVAEIDRYADFCAQYAQRDQYLIKFALKSVIQEIAQKRETVVWAEWVAPSRLGILLQLEDGQDGQEQSIALLEHVRQWVEDHLKLTVTIGVGEIAPAFAAIPACFSQALQALDYKMMLGRNRIVCYGEVTKEGQGNAFAYFQHVHAMVQSFRSAKEDWRDQFRAIFRNIGQQLLNKDDIVYLAGYMMYSLGKEMSSMAKEFQELWTEEGLPALNEALNASDTLGRLEHHFEQALGRLYEKLRAVQENRQHAGTIRDIRTYMEKCFADPNLSLDDLSDRFEINGKYLSKLFKEETGERFIDYLIGLRMRHACRLLAETDRHVQDIAECVGYTSSISFSRAFKKTTGLSPGDYRDRAVRGGAGGKGGEPVENRTE